MVAQSSCAFHLLTVYFNLISGISRASTFLFNDFTFYLLHIPNPFLSLKFILAPPHSGLCTYNYHPGMLCCIRAALSAVIFMQRLAVSLLSGLIGMRISVPCWYTSAENLIWLTVFAGYELNPAFAFFQMP